jgi:hypothetical protein
VPGFCENGHEPAGLRKMQGISSLAKKLLDSQEEFCSIELGKSDRIVIFVYPCKVAGPKKLSTCLVRKNMHKLAQSFPLHLVTSMSAHICNISSDKHFLQSKSQTPVFGEDHRNSY